ncbi:hypothetical protein [Mucilaginibacter ginkgonis]|uniref:Uncharacterized protein n=1 Tax=Mucilaginibacter ginkgonis TaxID=2682091 RepID=A0A6I4I3T0_9SPHI|nr:hypothetical protein [Mucilaginibacter ginkgonis]QQL48716.1 hypothetical protein GO620_011050 [Mucilaginibacter ginkgonis]
MKKATIVIIVLLLCVGALTIKSSAQCAMCSATVETNNKSGNTQANGLNNGIMYLLAAPYLAVAAGAYIWYKKYRRKDVDLNMRNEKIHLN